MLGAFECTLFDRSLKPIHIINQDASVIEYSGGYEYRVAVNS